MVCLRAILPADWIDRLRQGVEDWLASPHSIDMTGYGAHIAQGLTAERAAALATNDGRAGAGHFHSGTDSWRALPLFAEFATVSPLPCIVAGLLRVALRNLLANADPHAPDGGVVDVAVRHDQHSLRIEVSNPGACIPEMDRERLFLKYYRGQNARAKPGAGLGLYLVSRIAARLGGSVVLAQAGGDEPVTFRLSLPLRFAQF